MSGQRAVVDQAYTRRRRRRHLRGTVLRGWGDTDLPRSAMIVWMISGSDLRYSFLIAFACAGVRCGDVETGYVLGAEVPADLGAMYGQIGQSSSCLNQFPQGSYRCELFQYIPCARTVEPWQEVAFDVP